MAFVYLCSSGIITCSGFQRSYDKDKKVKYKEWSLYQEIFSYRWTTDAAAALTKHYKSANGYLVNTHTPLQCVKRSRLSQNLCIIAFTQLLSNCWLAPLCLCSWMFIAWMGCPPSPCADRAQVCSRATVFDWRTIVHFCFTTLPKQTCCQCPHRHFLIRLHQLQWSLSSLVSCWYFVW